MFGTVVVAIALAACGDEPVHLTVDEPTVDQVATAASPTTEILMPMASKARPGGGVQVAAVRRAPMIRPPIEPDREAFSFDDDGAGFSSDDVDGFQFEQEKAAPIPEGLAYLEGVDGATY